MSVNQNFVGVARYTWGGFSSGSTSTNLTVETTVLIYLDVPSVVVFDIVYLTGLTNASDPSNGEGTLSSFPSFHVEDDGGNNTKKGWMTWSGNSESFTDLSSESDP